MHIYKHRRYWIYQKPYISAKLLFDMEDKKVKFIKIYSKLPARIRGDIIVVIDKKPYTWDVAYFEINNDTLTGKKILEKLVELEII